MKSRRITKIVAEEFSLVTKPANRRPVLSYKAMGTKMRGVAERMDEMGMSAADMADAADIDEERMTALMDGDEDPTDEEMEAMGAACDACEEEYAKQKSASEKSKKSADVPSDVPLELVRHLPVVATARPTSHDEDVLMASLAGLAKAWTSAYGDVPRRDGEPDGVSAEDRTREANRIDAHGIAEVASGALYPDIHVPPARVAGA